MARKKRNLPVGRSTVRTEQNAQNIIDAIAVGSPQKYAAMSTGVAESTYHLWREEDPAFEARVQRAIAASVVYRVTRIQKAGEKSWQADAWWLERQLPNEFGRKDVNLRVSGDRENPLQAETTHHFDLSPLSDEELVIFLAMTRKIEAAAMNGNGHVPDPGTLTDDDE